MEEYAVSFKCLGGVGGESEDVDVIAVGHDEARWEFFLELVEDGLEGHAVEEAAPATALPTAHLVRDGGGARVGGNEDGSAGAVHKAEERLEVWEVGAYELPHDAAVVGAEGVAAIGADGNVGRVVVEVGLDGGGHEVAAAGDANAELFGFGVVAEEVGVGLFA